MPKREYTFSRAAHKQRKNAALNRGADISESKIKWRVIRIPETLAVKFEESRRDPEEALWKVIQRLSKII